MANKRGESARRNRKRKKDALYMSKFSDKYHKEQEALLIKKKKKSNNKKKEESETKIKNKENKQNNEKKVTSKKKYVNPDAADLKAEKVFRGSSSVKQAKEKHAKIAKDKANQAGAKKAKGATTKGGPVKDGVKFARSKGDDLAGFRRGPGTGRKDTRITKRLKKSGFTEDRLARLRKKNAEFQAKKKAFRKNKKNRNQLKKKTGG